MLEGQPGGHEELWVVDPPPDQGQEGNLRMWEEAELYLDHLCNLAERRNDNEGIQVALVDAYNRCIEERRRCVDLLELHEKWARRRIGGVVEPAE